MTRILTAALAMLMAASLSPALAQNYNLNPNYGSYSLSSGFLPDPQSVNVRAGGNINVGNTISGCRGYITNQPDVRLFYQAGGFSLSFYVRSNADTTLVVNDPNGRWYCNDDYQGLDPAVVFNNPLSGQYDIWIGTYSQGSTNAPATLFVSELGPF
jgi:hypothetical protein